MTKVKICGMTTLNDIDCVNQYQADFAGFVLFYPKSRRNLSPASAARLRQALRPSVKSVAVVVSPTLEQLRVLEDEVGCDYLQIHGPLREEVLTAARTPILRAFNGTDTEEFERCCRCGKIAGFVFDAAEPGSGQRFDWSSVKQLQWPQDKLMLLAGGLNADNVAQAIDYLHPDGVDVSSGVENDDGRGKDSEKVRAFIRCVRECDSGQDGGCC